MKPVSVSADISKEEIENLLSQLVKEAKEETFVQLAFYFMLCREQLEEILAYSATNAPLSATIPTSIMQGERVVAQIGSLDDDPGGHLIMQASRCLALNATLLTWAMDRALKTHNLTRDDFVGWINRTHMFGDGMLLSEGIAAWIDGDHIKAMHVLIPQVEAAFRKMVGMLGLPTTEPHPQMTRARNARPFGKILGDVSTATALQNHGPDLVLHLRALYIDPRGYNLRNNLAHGLLPSANINATTSLLVIHSLLLLGAWLNPQTLSE
jgi:hypothetical protein